MKILHAISTMAARAGGPPKVLAEMGTETHRRGNQVTVYTTDIDGAGRLDVPLEKPVIGAGGVEYRYFRVWPHNAYGFSIPFAKAIAKAVPHFDLVHIHSIYRFTTAVTAFFCRRYGVPYIVRPHGTLEPVIYSHHTWRKRLYERLIENRNLRGAAAIQFTADSEMENALSRGLEVNGVVVRLGLDLPANPSPRQTDAMHRLWPETICKKVLLFIGRLYYQKGLDLLAKAFGQLAKERGDIHLLLAGPDDEAYAEQVRQWLKEAGVLDKTTFTGLIAGAEKAAVFAGADVFVLSSYGENFAIAVVEAMAEGLPVVVTNKVAIWQEVVEGKAGLATNCDADEFSRAVRTILDDDALRQEMSDNGPALVRERFGWQGAGDRLMEMYESVVDANRQKVRPSRLGHREPIVGH